MTAVSSKKDTEHIFTRFQLDEALNAIRGKTLGEVDSAHVFNKTKTNPKVTGIAGDVIEQSVLGYPPDPKQRPDLIVDGEEVELKTTGLRPSKKVDGLEAKEPMSITAVSLDKIASEEFYTSNFWHKLKRLLIVYYLYDSSSTVTAGEYARFEIKGHQFFEFSEQEIETLKNDWQLVHDYVERLQRESVNEAELKVGYAKLSSALRRDLMMIDTAPKYPHPPRFRLKRSVVTYMARKVFRDEFEILPAAVSSFDELDRALKPIVARYAGKKLSEVFVELGLSSSDMSKAASEKMLVAMLGGKGKINKIELFVKTGIKVKTIVLTKDNRRTEDMKLCGIDFYELMTCPSYDESLLRDYLSASFVMAILQEPSTKAPLGENVFLGFKRFSFEDEFVDGAAKTVWDECRRLIREDELTLTPVLRKGTGEPIVNRTGTVREQSNFPKSKDHILFVRGTSSDSTRKPECINGLKMYRQQFWVRGEYMADMLKNLDWV